MGKMLLISNGLGAVPEFIGKSGADVVFVPTAADLDADKSYMEKDRAFLQKKGFAVTELKLDSKLSPLEIANLKSADALYISGGNSFYLLKMILESGLSNLLPDLLKRGLLYIGASAGAVVAGPSLEPIRTLDSPSAVNLSSLKALGLVDFVPLPHYDKESSVYQEILNTFDKTFQLVPLTDTQAIEVSGPGWKVVPSAQST